MTDPTRMIDDPSLGARLRADLSHAGVAGVEGFDTAVGMAGLKAAIAAETTSVAVVGSGISKTFVVAIAGTVLGLAGVAGWMSQRDDAHRARSVVGASIASVTIPSLDVAVTSATDELSSDTAKPVTESFEPKRSEAPKTVETHRSRVVRERKPKRPSQDEATLIAQARRSMRSDPAESLRLLKRAKASFPTGLLVEEREALTILTLSELGNDERARRAGERFLRRHAESPYADAVRRAIEDLANAE